MHLLGESVFFFFFESGHKYEVFVAFTMSIRL